MARRNNRSGGEPTVSAGYAKALLDVAVARGANQTALLDGAGLALAQLVDQDHRVPFARYVALMTAAKALCGDPALALHFGETAQVADFSIVGLIVGASTTVQEAFEQANRLGSLVIDVPCRGPNGRLQIVRAGGDTYIEDTRLNPNAFPELTESSFAFFAAGWRRDMGAATMANAIHVTHAAPSYRAEYDRVLRLPVVFESELNAIYIDDTFLSRSLAPSNRYVWGVLSDRAAELLASLESSRSARGRVEKALLPILHTGTASMQVVATTLGLSRQSLYRALAAEGVTFEIVLDELRHQMALHYLGGQKVSVHQAAYLVGFADPASFSRAFKRWTGTSPSSVRR
jgi:AraC-like DNA-binding protein